MNLVVRSFVAALFCTTLWLAAAASAQQAKGGAEEPVAHAPVVNLRQTKGKALANLLAPQDLVETMSVGNFERGLRSGLKANPEHQKLEAIYPGLTDAMIEAVKPRGMEIIRESREPYLVKVGAFFAERFTLAEIDQGLRFYSLPFMIRTNRKMLQSIQGDAVLADVRAQVVSGATDPQISMSSIKRDLDQGSRKAAAQINPIEMRQIAAFARTPFAAKFQRNQAALNTLVVFSVNQQAAQISSDESLRTQALAAMAEFVARADAAKSVALPGEAGTSK
jgi:hypothetical protein